MPEKSTHFKTRPISLGAINSYKLNGFSKVKDSFIES